MTLIYRGEGEPSTIIGGVLLLVREHMIPIALVIFIASIAVPFLKVIGLIVLPATYNNIQGYRDNWTLVHA